MIINLHTLHPKLRLFTYLIFFSLMASVSVSIRDSQLSLVSIKDIFFVNYHQAYFYTIYIYF